MSVRIAGMGWVTPLGSGVPGVWDRLLRGEEATAKKISDPVSAQTYMVFPVPDPALVNLPPHPRLRRASSISRFAAGAGLAALEDAKLTINTETAERIALVFAISNGGVIYTKRFYHDIVSAGAEAARPLLFPETVFNAPASHLAAIMGMTGRSYTLIGDGAVGLFAIRMAEDLMANDDLDYCLVVGTEEADWLLCDAYRRWRLLRSTPPIEPFHKPAKGMILSEGAGAILLGRKGFVEIDITHVGTHYAKRRDAGESLRQVLDCVGPVERAVVIASANGTFIDEVEAQAVSKILPDAIVYTPKAALGESVGAGSLWQVIVAVQALRTGRLPPLLHVTSEIPFRVPTTTVNAVKSDCAIVMSCGLSQQVAGLRLSI